MRYTLQLTTRVFGFKINDTLVRLEDADYKRSLIISNIAWGTELSHIMIYLRNQLEVDTETPISPETQITSQYIILRLNHFETTLRVLKEIHQATFVVSDVL
jgi:hypothetical protein